MFQVFLMICSLNYLADIHLFVELVRALCSSWTVKGASSLPAAQTRISRMATDGTAEAFLQKTHAGFARFTTKTVMSSLKLRTVHVIKGSMLP